MPATGSHTRSRKSAERQPPFSDARVGERFAEYPHDVRERLYELRQLIFDVAANTDTVGPLVETLKWNQPAYLPKTSRIGTTIRIDAVKDQPGVCALYVHCQTTLIATFRHLYRDQFDFDGNRAMIVPRRSKLPRQALRHCIGLALTYHLDRKR